MRENLGKCWKDGRTQYQIQKLLKLQPTLRRTSTAPIPKDIYPLEITESQDPLLDDWSKYSAGDKYRQEIREVPTDLNSNRKYIQLASCKPTEHPLSYDGKE